METMKIFDVIPDCEINEKGTITSTITSSKKDIDNDVLLPSGINLKRYETNPIVLWAHEKTTLPIGRNQWVKYDKDKNALVAKTEFAKTPFAQEVFQLYKDGFLKAWSVGVVYDNTREPTNKEVEDNPEWKGSTIVDQYTLLEYSAVPIGANEEALTLAVSKGIISEDTQKRLLDLKIEVDKAIVEEETEDEVIVVPPRRVKIHPRPNKKRRISHTEIVKREIRRLHGRCF